jgi:pSer/pThr/pTyr-binding forkhead associated (FHA) protein
VVTIGRASDCDCVLTNDTVSRRHARLRYAHDAWLLTDLGSTNGTRVNGWRVAGEVEVRVGDRVSFGTARFRLTHG